MIIKLARSLSGARPIKVAFNKYGDEQVKNSPLIIMHGLFGSKTNWHTTCVRMQPQLKPQRKIISIDARNHGDSPHEIGHTYPQMAADLKYLIDSEQLGAQVILLGHSMGARAFMYFALEYPKLVEKLIVVDASPISVYSPVEHMRNILSAMEQMKFDKNITISKARHAANKSLAGLVTDPNVRQFLLLNFMQNSEGSFKWRVNVPALLANLEHIMNYSLMEIQKTYTGPAFFIAGGNSVHLPENDYPSIQKLFPTAEFQRIPGAGHLIHVEKPNEFLSIVLNFLNK